MRYLKNIPKLGRSLKNPTCLSIIRGQLTPRMAIVQASRSKTDDPAGRKDKHNKVPFTSSHGSKEEPAPAPTPGFVRPEVLCDEGFFTQKARQQIEEQKKKQPRPSMNNPEQRP